MQQRLIDDIYLLASTVVRLVGGTQSPADECTWGELRNDEKLVSGGDDGDGIAPTLGADNTSQHAVLSPEPPVSSTGIKERLVAVTVSAFKLGIVGVSEPPAPPPSEGNEKAKELELKHTNIKQIRRALARAKDLRLTVDGSTDSFGIKVLLPARPLTRKHIEDMIFTSSSAASTAAHNERVRVEQLQVRKDAKLSAMKARLDEQRETRRRGGNEGVGQEEVEASLVEEEVEEIEEVEEEDEEDEDNERMKGLEDGDVSLPPPTAHHENSGNSSPPPPTPKDEDDVAPPPPTDDEPPPPPPDDDPPPPPPPEVDDPPPPPPEDYDDDPPPPPPEEGDDDPPPPPPENA